MLQQIKEGKPVYNPTRSVWWRSAHCRSCERRNRTRASHKLMTSRSSLTRLAYPIPLGSILTLLLVLITAIIVPSSNNTVLALEINSNNDASSAGTNTNTSNSLSNDNYTNTTNNNLSAYNATTYANNALSLSIGGAGQSEAVKTVAGEVAYRAHTVNVSATNMKTYSISINGPVGLKNDTGNTTIVGAGNTIPNGTGSTMMPDNSWGYAYGQTGDNANMTYSSFTNTDQIIDTANTTPNFTKNLVFAAKFGEEANVGHYTAIVTLSITATPKVITEYTLSYNANGGSNAPNLQTYTDDTEAGSHTFTIPSTKPTRSGYEFAGWSTTSTGTASYQPGGAITLQAANPSQTLYAVWKDAGASWSDGTNSGITYMQDITTGTGTNSFCSSSLPTHASITLKDRRDESSYTIVKMADGKCWMTSNLKITGTIQASESDFTSPNSITIPNSKSGFTSSDQYALKGYVSGNTGYYNWYTATAQAGTSSITTDGTNVNSSICPKNWKLPTGSSSTSNNDFYKLTRAEGIADSSAGSTKIRGTPYNFAYTGYIYNGSLNNTTSRGNWWSRTAGDATNAYSMRSNSSSVYPGTYTYNRYDGFAVRCVAK